MTARGVGRPRATVLPPGCLGVGVGGWTWNTFTAVLGPEDFTQIVSATVIAPTSGGLLYLCPGNGSGGWLRSRLIGRGWNVFSTHHQLWGFQW